MSCKVFNITDEQRKAIENASWEYRGSDGSTVYLHLPMKYFPGASIPMYEMTFDTKRLDADIRNQESKFSPDEYAISYYRKNGGNLQAGLEEGKFIKRKLNDLVSEFNKIKQGIKDKKKFEDKCYEAYKLHWMLSHGVTLSEYLDGIAKSADEVKMDENPKKRTPREQLVYDSEDYFVYETGFGNGSCYVCKKEFLETEFLDKDYMHYLLGLLDDSQNLKAFYDENYVEEEKPKEGEIPFYVTFRVRGYYIPEVYAKSEEEARKKAMEMYSEADFGELEDIDTDCIHVEDEDGNYVWEK